MAAVADFILDTGPVVALLSRKDTHHERCVEWFAAFRGRLLTTEPVLTEVMHLLGPRGSPAGLDFFLRAGALLVPLNGERLARCRALMSQYADVPMDLADASLVALAEEVGIGNIFTLDLRGFATYRWRRNRRFTLAP